MHRNAANMLGLVTGGSNTCTVIKKQSHLMHKAANTGACGSGCVFAALRGSLSAVSPAKGLSTKPLAPALQRSA